MAIQNSYSFDRTKGLAGGWVYDCPPEGVRAAAAQETIKAGKFLAYAGGSRDKVKLPQLNKLISLFDADLIASNVFTAGITRTDIDGTAAAEQTVQITFATSHAATMTAIQSAFNALTDVTATLTDATNNREITLVIDNDNSVAVSTTFVVTSGASQAGTTVTEASADEIIGISGQEDLEPDSNGDVQWLKYDMVPIKRKGEVYANNEETLALTDTLFARFTAGAGADQERGTIRASAGSAPVVATALPSTVKLSAGDTANGLVEVDLNIP